MSITDERGKDYGPVRDNFERIAAIWGAILGATVTAEQVGLCMIGVKMARETFKHTPDNLVDIKGYADCIRVLEGEHNDK